MKIIIRCKEIPNSETMRKIGEMLQEGYQGGVHQPPGVIWNLSIPGTKLFLYPRELRGKGAGGEK